MGSITMIRQIESILIDTIYANLLPFGTRLDQSSQSVLIGHLNYAIMDRKDALKASNSTVADATDADTATAKSNFNMKMSESKADTTKDDNENDIEMDTIENGNDRNINAKNENNNTIPQQQQQQQQRLPLTRDVIIKNGDVTNMIYKLEMLLNNNKKVKNK